MAPPGLQREEMDCHYSTANSLEELGGSTRSQPIHIQFAHESRCLVPLRLQVALRALRNVVEHRAADHRCVEIDRMSMRALGIAAALLLGTAFPTIAHRLVVVSDELLTPFRVAKLPPGSYRLHVPYVMEPLFQDITIVRSGQRRTIAAIANVTCGKVCVVPFQSQPAKSAPPCLFKPEIGIVSER